MTEGSACSLAFVFFSFIILLAQNTFLGEYSPENVQAGVCHWRVKKGTCLSNCIKL